MTQFKSNGYSCMLDATSKVTGIPFLELASAVGHDGLNCGTTAEEIITVLVDLNWTCTQITREGMGFDPRTMGLEPITFRHSPKYRDAEERWDWMLLAGDGIIQGYRRNGNTHAMAWIDGSLFDKEHPQGMLMDEEVFRPFKFLLISERGGL